ncbi:MAG: mechanosensitive ion channel family protein [Xanthomonadales bacterium]
MLQQDTSNVGTAAPASAPPASAPEGSELVDRFLDLNQALDPLVPEPLMPAWTFLQDYPLLLVLVMAVLGYGVGKALQWFLQTSLSQATRRTRNKLDDRLIDYLTAPVVQTSIILGLVAATKAFGFSETVDHLFVRTLFSLLILLWGRAWFRATSLAIQTLSQDADHFAIFQPRTRPLFEISVKLVLFSLLVWLFMALWNIDGTAWLASAGVIGIAVGFAARDTLANLISGVSIIADAPYKIGDYIILDTGERGVVTEVGMRSTRLLTRDDVEISIPNAVMGNAKITNESGGPAIEHRIRIPVGVAYGTRPRKVVDLLEDIARTNDMVIDTPAPRARMRGFGPSSLDFELLGWIRYPEQRGLATHRLLVEIEERFREEGIEIPFQQHDLHIKSIERERDPPSSDED